jgi:rubrerythrin
MPTTQDNLKEAFAGESQANQKYRAFAKKAEKEGYPNIARLFLTTAEAERIHAEGHLGALEGIGSTADNLQAAIDGETDEFTQMYPPMLEQAEAEGHKAKRMFHYAVKAEEVHANLYKQALEAVLRGEDLTETEFYLCPICGHIEFGSPPDACPVCQAKAASFVQI